jgi:hypothetical protein
MSRQKLTNVLASTTIALGALFLAKPVAAADLACWLSTSQIIGISDIVCGDDATGYRISDVSCTDTEASWTVTCYY